MYTTGSGTAGTILDSGNMIDKKWFNNNTIYMGQVH